MIENRIHLLEVESIDVQRDERFRRKLESDHLAALSESIKDHGLIHAIVVDKETKRLIAGENRVNAFERLALREEPCKFTSYEDWTKIPVRFATKPSMLDMRIIELSENMNHRAMSWQDTAAGMLQTCAMLEEELGEEYSQAEVARRLGVTAKVVSETLMLGRNLGDPEIRDCSSKITALNILRRKMERKLDSIVENIGFDPAPQPQAKLGTEETNQEIRFDEPEQPTTAKAAPEPVPLGDFYGYAGFFQDFVRDYTGPKFNLIHFDPPYGVGLHKSSTMRKSGRGQYEDTKDLFDELSEFLLDHAVPAICSHSSHIVFWHSAGDREKVNELLASRGWRVWPYPLIWHKSCNTGLFPDSNRGPRHTYEMATLASLGDRKIVRLVADSVAHQATKESGHESEKPVAMLEHFFRMLVDDSSRVLDPTGGSGNALRAAQNLHAAGGVFCELEEHYVKVFNKEQANAGIEV